MGRHAGWIATYSGIAGGADVILIPEVPVDLDEVVPSTRASPLARARTSPSSWWPRAPSSRRAAEALAALDESATCGWAASGSIVAEEIEKRTGFETRVTVLGHIQRGGTPTAHDRVLATRFGVFACDLVAQGEFGKMAGRKLTSFSSPRRKMASSKCWS